MYSCSLCWLILWLPQGCFWGIIVQFICYWAIFLKFCCRLRNFFFKKLWAVLKMIIDFTPCPIKKQPQQLDTMWVQRRLGFPSLYKQRHIVSVLRHCHHASVTQRGMSLHTPPRPLPRHHLVLFGYKYLTCPDNNGAGLESQVVPFKISNEYQKAESSIESLLICFSWSVGRAESDIHTYRICVCGETILQCTICI